MHYIYIYKIICIILLLFTKNKWMESFILFKKVEYWLTPHPI